MKNISYTRGTGILEEFLAKQRAKKANSFISKEQRKGKILDIGCGSYPYFLTSIAFKEKYGIDPSLKSPKPKNIILEKIDITENKLSFKDNYFNVVTMLAVFEHIDTYKLGELIVEIKRILKKDGVLIITTPAPWADKVLHYMARIGLISSEEIHEHKHNHARTKIEDMIESAGFDIRNIKSGFFELYMNMWFIVRND